MSAETFTTAMFLITAVIAAGVLINAVFPVVYQMAGTFSSATHSSDVRLRTDFVIVATFAKDSDAQVYMKNVGSQPISLAEIAKSDVFFGPVGSFKRMETAGSGTSPSNGRWQYKLDDLNGNSNWDTGETLEIYAKNNDVSTGSGSLVYFQFVLPNAIYRSGQFTTS
jgi:flagellar protein FlaG